MAIWNPMGITIRINGAEMAIEDVMNREVRIFGITEYVYEPHAGPLPTQWPPKRMYRGPLEGIVVRIEGHGGFHHSLTVLSRRKHDETTFPSDSYHIEFVEPGEFTTENLWQGQWVNGEFVPDKL